MNTASINNKSKSINLRLSDELLEKIKLQATINNISVSAWVINACRDKLEKEEMKKDGKKGSQLKIRFPHEVVDDIAKQVENLNFSKWVVSACVDKLESIK